MNNKLGGYVVGIAQMNNLAFKTFKNKTFTVAKQMLQVIVAFQRSWRSCCLGYLLKYFFPTENQRLCHCSRMYRTATFHSASFHQSCAGMDITPDQKVFLPPFVFVSNLIFFQTPTYFVLSCSILTLRSQFMRQRWWVLTVAAALNRLNFMSLFMLSVSLWPV